MTERKVRFRAEAVERQKEARPGDPKISIQLSTRRVLLLTVLIIAALGYFALVIFP